VLKLAISNKIIEAIRASAIKYLCIRRIGVFGSYARGENDDTSDIDILYDYDTSCDDSTDQILAFMDDFEDMMKPLAVDFICFNCVIKKDDDFRKATLNEVIWIYDAQTSTESV